MTLQVPQRKDGATGQCEGGAPPHLQNMRAARLFPGHEWRRRVSPPYQTVANHPTGSAAAKGLATLPDGGAPSHGHLGRASSFAKATEDKDARPSRGEGRFHHGYDGELSRRPAGRGEPSHGHGGGEGSRRPTGRCYAFTLAHWPSLLLRQGYGGQGRSALPFIPLLSATPIFHTSNPYYPWPPRATMVQKKETPS